MRDRIFEVIEVGGEKDRASTVYDSFMMAVIVISMIPLAFKRNGSLLEFVNTASTLVFVIDYILRLSTADKKLKRGVLSFMLYPFTPMAIIDFLAIFPFFVSTFSSLRVVKLLRLGRTLRVFRSFKIFRHAKSIRIIVDVIKAQKSPLLAVCSLAAGYILISALIVFNVEPDTFNTFFDAIYWATVSLTTVGYGDIYPVTTAGRLVAMTSSLVGIAIVALPAGIITAGYMEEIKKEDTSGKERPSRL